MQTAGKDGTVRRLSDLVTELEAKVGWITEDATKLEIECRRLRALNAELVEALEEAEAWMTLAPISPKQPALNKARAVLAKAKGEQ